MKTNLNKINVYFLINLGFLLFINSNFSPLVSFLILASSLEASERFLNFLEYTSKTGLLMEVYLAPSLELLCSETLRFKSVVIPV